MAHSVLSRPKTGVLRARFFGDFAAFIGPKKDEPVSYPAPSPSAARALMEGILWKPAIRYDILRIHLLKPIQWFSSRVNEVSDRCDPSREIVVEESRIQRRLTGLKDVDYVIEANFRSTPSTGPEETPAKFIEMFNRRLENGQCHMQPYFGRREFPAYFEPAPDEIGTPSCTIHTPPELSGRTIDVGMMFLDRQYKPTITSEFFHAEIKNGVLVEAGKDVLPFFDSWEHRIS